MTTLTAPRRDEALVNPDSGRSSLRFANTIEDTLGAVNSLLEFEFIPVSTQEGSYTFVLTDANTIVRKTEFSGAQTYQIPARTDVEYELGTTIEVHNDTPGDLTIAITDDTLQASLAVADLTFTSLTTGSRLVASFGFARFVLVDIEDVTWKITGDQMT